MPVLVAVIAIGIGACGPDQAASTDSAEETVNEPAEPDPTTAVEFLASGKGRVVVLLLGMEGCAKTMQATRDLAKLAPDLPDDVRVARLDVPQRNDALLGIEDWPHPYFYAVDEDREVADPLDFFYYPTLYLLDREGEVRFAGGCEPEKLVAMIEKVRTEEPGDEKTVFTPPLPAVGTPAPGFTATSLDGETISPDALREDGSVFLFFTSKSCPFSAAAVGTLADLAEEAADVDVTFVAIEKGGAARAVKAFYAKLDLPGPVIHDADGSICKSFGVEPAPFFFLIGEDGTIATRGPYTEAAALGALGLDGGVASSMGAG